MITFHTKCIAEKLESYARQKIDLAETILNKKLSTEECDELYCAAIKDQYALVFSTCPHISAQELYLALQIAEMSSPENIYFTGLHVNHKPTDEEIREHYINSGRPSRFREKFQSIFDNQQ